MKINTYSSYEEMCKHVVEDIRYAINFNMFSEYFTLGLATGSTPLGIYKYMRDETWDAKKITTYNLDEYCDLPYNHPHSYEHFMEENLFVYKQFRHSYFPTNDRYDDMIQNNGGIDIQILGIGTNGHIAFNEPGSSRDSLTRKVELTENTRKDNSRFFDSIDDVPTHAWTMGIESIMRARQIYLLANGKHKKDILEKAVYGDITPDIPASFLQEHDNVQVFYCD
jgi:glucosamine-6-phosphate deaminase